MYEIVRGRKKSYFQYKISNVRPYIHNLSAMKLTNCVEIKLSAPPTAKGGLQLLHQILPSKYKCP